MDRREGNRPIVLSIHSPHGSSNHWNHKQFATINPAGSEIFSVKWVFLKRGKIRAGDCRPVADLNVHQYGLCRLSRRRHSCFSRNLLKPRYLCVRPTPSGGAAEFRCDFPRNVLSGRLQRRVRWPSQSLPGSAKHCHAKVGSLSKLVQPAIKSQTLFVKSARDGDSAANLKIRIGNAV